MDEMMENLPKIQYRKVEKIQVKRFSSRQMSSMRLNRIKGEVWLDNVPSRMLPYLFAGSDISINL